MKLLIIEDEPKAAAYSRQGLSEAGYIVDVAADGEAGLTAARLDEYALILCDPMLPTPSWRNCVAAAGRCRCSC